MAGCEPIRAYRTSKNLTQEALGKELGVTGITVSRWETGARKIDLKILPDVSRKLGIPKRELRPDLVEAVQ